MEVIILSFKYKFLTEGKISDIAIRVCIVYTIFVKPFR